MPVHHEKTEKPKRETPTIPPKDMIRNSSKQREVSIERRPIISQSKPSASTISKTTLDAKKKINKTVAGSKTSSVATSSTKKEPQKYVKNVPTSSTNLKVKKSDTSAKIGSISQSKEKIVSTSKTQPKILQSNKEHKKSTLKTAQEKLSKTETLSKPIKVTKKTPEPPQALRISRDRTRTRTLSPSEIKALPEEVRKNQESLETNQVSVDDRLRRENSESSNENETEASENADFDYEDDFEDYESDFEEDTEDEQKVDSDSGGENEKDENEQVLVGSADRKRILLTAAEERERKLDSGSYHISPASYNKEIQQVKLALQQENLLQQNSVPEDNCDEGYLEEGEKSAENSMLDFTKAGKELKGNEALEKVLKRGEELSKMITLDAVTYNLMDIPPVPYQIFMASYGNSNTSQVHVQTNEDDTEEGIQTEDVDFSEKWTQAPPAFSKSVTDTGEKHFIYSKLESGGNEDRNEDDLVAQTFPSINYNRLNSFLSARVDNILAGLEASEQSEDVKNSKKSDLPICEHLKTINTQNGNETGRTLINVIATNKHMATAEKTNTGRTVLKIWNNQINQASFKPIKVLKCYQEITTMVFAPGTGTILFAGASDGSINLWDLRVNHKICYNQEEEMSPTYSTAEILKNNSHCSAIVSILILSKDEKQDNEFRPMQICSLDRDGNLITWSVIQLSQNGTSVVNTDLGMAPWGRLRLIPSSTVQLSQLIHEGTDVVAGYTSGMWLKGSSEPQLFITTDNGQILHCRADGNPLNPRLYLPSKNASPSVITTLAIYPIDDQYFIAGCSDGFLRLYKIGRERPLLNMHWSVKDANPTSGIKSIHWISSKPCIYIVVDASSRAHVWNLAVSDIYPQYTTPSTSIPITSSALLQEKSHSGSIIFAKSSGALEIHSLRTDKDKLKANEVWKKEAKMFQRYVNIL